LQPHNDAGFSLVETLVAFTMLTVILLASLDVFGSGIFRLGRAQDAVTAQEALRNARAKLEAGIAPEQLGDGVTVTLRPLTKEAVPWTTLVPFHATLELNGAKLETIVIRHGAKAP
jgi:type II secretory pathway pseudopilin PulG